MYPSIWRARLRAYVRLPVPLVCDIADPRVLQLPVRVRSKEVSLQLRGLDQY